MAGDGGHAFEERGIEIEGGKPVWTRVKKVFDAAGRVISETIVKVDATPNIRRGESKKKK